MDEIYFAIKLKFHFVGLVLARSIILSGSSNSKFTAAFVLRKNSDQRQNENLNLLKVLVIYFMLLGKEMERKERDVWE
jgi:hypothetical protein